MTSTVRRRVDVTGVVQAVGFRPYVHALASGLGLVGSVRNLGECVRVEVQGPESTVNSFIERLRIDPPALAQIDEIRTAELPHRGASENTFRILPSRGGQGGRGSWALPPDTAPCAACVAEMSNPADRRYRHPFIACTQCGPRLTIAERLPHDRAFTTMADFEMCASCRSEYEDPSDRRHHAQPIACTQCGPRLTFVESGPTDSEVFAAGDDAFTAAQTLLAAGGILAVKGLGGYHLAVDATSPAAVERLRDRKRRPDKPFAVMVADLNSARELAWLDAVETSALCSPARPVVLANARRESCLVPEVAPGSPLVGVMLPSSPIHHLLFGSVPGAGVESPSALVMTSGNLAGEPICHDDADVRIRLGSIADGFLQHDRRIHTPCDDSVVRVIDGSMMPIRRSRGVAPLPVRLPFSVPATLAVGADIKNTFAIADGRYAWLSQHVGDLENLASVEALARSVDLLTRLAAAMPARIVADRHPGYRSRRWAVSRVRADPELELVDVDHHHAHAAALMAEHGLGIDSSLLTFVFDGTGLGPDGRLWGGEVLQVRYDGFERMSHLSEVPLPGAGAAISNPCRMALAHLRSAGIEWTDDIPAVAACSSLERDVIESQFSTAPLSSSMGRLFDAVASILGLRHRISYEAQAAIELEFCAASALDEGPRLRFGRGIDGAFDATPLLIDLVAALRSGVDRSLLARSFHDAVVAMIVESARQHAPPETAVGLSGGVFQNAWLATESRRRLEAEGYRVLSHQIVPPNDGGLALGQVMVAAARHRTEEASSCA